MTKPIIDPSTLSDEQREIIRAKYDELKEIESYFDGYEDIFAGDEAVFEWLFGKEFFKKG